MCGIVGFIDNEEKNKEKILKLMMEKIKHRGPDDNGFYIDNDIALGHLRLSILDVRNGHQPMISADENFILSYNGEIYNYLEIKKELENVGYKFKTTCDTEVLLNGYDYFGKNILKKIRGMFSFVIWDKKTKELFGARDFFGIKPLYYYKDNNIFLFASEIKAFFPNKNFKKIFNKDLLPNYLTFGFVPTKETFFKKVYSLDPGHYFIYKNNKLKIKRYFKYKFEEKLKTIDEFSSKINIAVKESIEKHKISDVDIGAFLSGGMDSSYIVLLSKPINTFTIGYNEQNYNETNNAKKFAKNLNIKNKSKIINKKEFFKNIKPSIYFMDEPVSDPSIISLYLLSKEASKYVKVILSGEGADEFFGGYNCYKMFCNFKFYDKIPYFFRNCISKLCQYLPNVKGINFLIRRGEKLENNYIGVNRVFNDFELNKILNDNYHNPKNRNLTKNIFIKMKNKSKVSKMQIVDLNFWFVKDILQKADKMSMANSIEVRVPFVDIEVFKIAKDLPEYAKVNKKKTKIALRKAYAQELLTNPEQEKKGFPVPIREWLKTDYIYDLIKKEFNSLISLNFFNNKKIIKLLDDAHFGIRDNYKKVWSIYIFLVWYKLFFK